MANKEDLGTKTTGKNPPVLDFGDAAKVVHDAAEMAEDALAKGVKKSSSLIKKYPLESALVCFGVGIVAGMFLRNRD